MKTFPVTIIIPVHALNPETTLLLKVALDSAYNQKEYAAERILVVGPVSVQTEVLDLSTAAQPVEFLLNGGATDIATQLNLAIASLTTKYVTVLELDDELGSDYLSEMALHVEAMPEVEGFLPLIACVDPQSLLLKYGNEGIWVPKTEEERPDGLLDAETCEVAPDMLLSGALLETSIFTQGCALKPAIEVSFINEFYRRIVARGHTLRGMAKVLYLHRERRPGSYIYELMVGDQAMSPEQMQFWFETARTESLYEIDRPITLGA